MRNFARIIDLGEVECVVRRVGSHELYFEFWLQDENDLEEPAAIVNPTAIMEFPHWFLDALFSGDKEENIKELASSAYHNVRGQLLMLEGSLEAGVPYSFTGPSLDLLTPPTEDA